jgi:hypothetical protein
VSDRGEAETAGEVVEGEATDAFGALLERVVARAAAADPVSAIPEQDLVALVRIEMIDQFRGGRLVDQCAVAAQRAGCEMALRRLVPAGCISTLAGRASASVIGSVRFLPTQVAGGPKGRRHRRHPTLQTCKTRRDGVGRAAGASLSDGCHMPLAGLIRKSLRFRVCKARFAAFPVMLDHTLSRCKPGP